MSKTKFVFAISFCAMFAVNAAVAKAPEGDTPGTYDSDIGTAHEVFENWPLTDGPSDGIAGVTYVNRAVNAAGAAAIAAEAHAAASGAYAVSAKSSADSAATAAGKAQSAADAANAALAGKADKSEIPTVNNATLTIKRNGELVDTFTANASDAKIIDITDNDTIYTLPKASASTLGGVKVGTNLSIDNNGVLSAKDTHVTVDSELSESSTNPVQNKVVKAALDGKADKSEIPTVNNATLTIKRNGTDVGTFTANASAAKTINIVDNDTIYTLPTASKTTLGGVKVGETLSIDNDGVLNANIVNEVPDEDQDIVAPSVVLTNSLIADANSEMSAILMQKQNKLTDSNVVPDGTGNVVTAVTAADGVVTVTKGTTLGSLATKSTVETDDIENGAVTAVKTNGVIGKVPYGSETSTTYASIWVK